MKTKKYEKIKYLFIDEIANDFDLFVFPIFPP